MNEEKKVIFFMVMNPQMRCKMSFSFHSHHILIRSWYFFSFRFFLAMSPLCSGGDYLFASALLINVLSKKNPSDRKKKKKKDRQVKRFWFLSNPTQLHSHRNPRKVNIIEGGMCFIISCVTIILSRIRSNETKRNTSYIIIVI